MRNYFTRFSIKMVLTTKTPKNVQSGFCLILKLKKQSQQPVNLTTRRIHWIFWLSQLTNWWPPSWPPYHPFSLIRLLSTQWLSDNVFPIACRCQCLKSQIQCLLLLPFFSPPFAHPFRSLDINAHLHSWNRNDFLDHFASDHGRAKVNMSPSGAIVRR